LSKYKKLYKYYYRTLFLNYKLNRNGQFWSVGTKLILILIALGMVEYIIMLCSVGYSAKITSPFAAKSFKTQIIPLSMCK